MANFSTEKKRPRDLRTFRLAHQMSVEKREAYWADQARELRWEHDFDQVIDEDFNAPRISWFDGGQINGFINALEVNLARGHEDKLAMIYCPEGQALRSYSYRTLNDKVTALANAIDAMGLSAGDRLAMSMPNRPGKVMFTLACARLGLIYVPIARRFSAEQAAYCVRDCGAKMVTVQVEEGEQFQRNYAEALKSELDDSITVVTVGGGAIDGAITYYELMGKAGDHTVEAKREIESEQPLFILYARTVIGIPVGTSFATGGFLVQAHTSFDQIFGSAGMGESFDQIFCALDLASAAGQCYGLWGPLLSGNTLVLTNSEDGLRGRGLEHVLANSEAEAILCQPNWLWDFKKEMGEGDLLGEHRFALVATCGDALTPRLVRFAGEKLTDSPDRVINLWVQTGSGAALINTYPKAELNRPGALGLAAPGIEPIIINDNGQPCGVNIGGQLVFKHSWPGMVRGIWGSEKRFGELYFRRHPGYFQSNDGMRLDPDGFFWFMGRLDDTLKIHGHSLSTSELEAIMLAYPKVKECAMVGTEAESGDDLVAFIVPEDPRYIEGDSEKSETLLRELGDYISSRIGPFARPVRFVFTHELPRTQSGKVVRRLLKRIAGNDVEPDEDLSHLDNPEVVGTLLNKDGD